MSILLTAGLGALLQSPVIQTLVKSAKVLPIKSIVTNLKEHFFFSSEELGEAFQESLKLALNAIASGLATEKRAKGFLGQLTKGRQLLVESKLSREFSQKLQKHYLDPFADQESLSQEERRNFAQRAFIIYKTLAEEAQKILPIEEISDDTWMRIATEPLSLDVSDWIVLRIQKINDIQPLEASFLKFDNLIGDALMFFFLEKMRKDERVRTTLQALQTQGLWANLQDINRAQREMQQALSQRIDSLQKSIETQRELADQAMLKNDFATLANVSQQLQSFQDEQKKLQERKKALSSALQEAQKAWQAHEIRLQTFEERFGQWCQVVSKQLAQILDALDEIAKIIGQIDENVGKIREEQLLQSEMLRELLTLMKRLQLSEVIKARDEFSIHDSQTRQVIHEVKKKIQKLPPSTRGYSMAMIHVSSALSSAGEVEESIVFLQKAKKYAQTPDEQALASYNLFQLYLRQQKHEEALTGLQQALAIDSDKYALHNIEKYPIKRILGAGGMGCAFLCSDWMRGQDVVVKVFWEAKKGPLDEVFSEVMLMAKIENPHIPKALDYGFVDFKSRYRPYIVMEYIEGAIDGEKYLEQYGKLSFKEALEVGIQILSVLVATHEKGVHHYDLKPANILLRRDPEQFKVWVIDFGLSRVATSLKQEAIAKSLSSKGKSIFVQEIFGTLDYAPPEQRGKTYYGPPDYYSDIYSFGATLYHLMTAKSPSFIHPRYLSDEPEFRDLLLDCMMSDPKDRPASASELLKQFKKIATKQGLLPESRFEEAVKKQLPQDEGLWDCRLERKFLSLGLQMGLDWQKTGDIIDQLLAPLIVKRKAVEEAKRKAAEEAKRKLEEEVRREKAKRKAAEEAKRKLEGEVRREEAKRKAAEEARRKLEEEVRREEVKRKAAEEAKRKAAEEARKRAEEAKRKSWLPKRVLRNVARMSYDRFLSGGSLPRNIPSLSFGIERKVILDRSGQPLLEMVKIPAGEFLVGSSDKDRMAINDEKPQRRLHLSDYWIARTPVTNRMWKRFLEESGYRPESDDHDGDYLKHWNNGKPPIHKLDHPVVYISYINAWAFCDFYGLVLPSEAQWEKAARGTDGRIYPWGEQKPTKDLCNFARNIGTTTPVGAYPQGVSPYSLLDCAGNVFEWCADDWDRKWLKKITSENSVNIDENRTKLLVIRGGAFDSSYEHVRSAYRGSHYAWHCNNRLGFRPVHVTVD